MKTHPDNAAAHEKAYAVLANIACNNDDNHVAIAAAGDIAVRIAALGHHLSDPALCLPLTSPTTQPQP